MEISIKVNDQLINLDSGLTHGQTLYEKASISREKLIFNQGENYTVLVEPTDFLVIKENDTFVTSENLTGKQTSENKVEIYFNGETCQLPKAKLSCRELKELDKELPNGRLFVAVDAEVDIEISQGMNIVIREGDSFIVIPSGEGNNEGDPIDIEICSKHNRRPPKGHRRFKIRIDREKFLVADSEISGIEILALVDKKPQEWALNQKFGGGRRKRVGVNEIVDLSTPGIERFETVLRQAQQGDANAVRFAS